MNDYEIVMGLEVHIELATQRKIFCRCKNTFAEAANTNVCPVCLGLPGALPVLNPEALSCAVRMGLALQGQINRNSRFDRKNYFYPDNATAYQITQFYEPILKGGQVEVQTEAGETKIIRIHEMHMEDDAGKLTHDMERRVSLVDFNRKGVPLLEIVTEPDFRNADEVIAFLEKIRMFALYLGISDGKLHEGSMRADVNLSLRKAGEEALGVRTEMKNLNSFVSIRRAIAYEAERQAQLLDAGGRILFETRRFDETSGTTKTMRTKEEVMDYRYFPEPDLLPVHLPEEYIRKMEEQMPEFPQAKEARYRRDFGLTEEEARILTRHPATAKLFEETLRLWEAGTAGVSDASAKNDGQPEDAETRQRAKAVAARMCGDLMYLCREKKADPGQWKITPEALAELMQMQEAGAITTKTARDVFALMFDKNIEPMVYVNEYHLLITKDEDALAAAVDAVLKAQEKSVSDYLSGKEKAAGHLLGCVMKETNGQADPAQARELLLKKLAERKAAGTT